MSNSNIHPTAVIEKGAQIGSDVVIEPYAIIKKNVVLHDRVVIKSHAYIDGNTTIGEGTTIWPSASIGTKTQDKKFQGETTFVKIGKHCEIREFVTINSSCMEGTIVEVGDHCLVMAYCHIAHNCRLGNHIVMANGAMLAGHVEVEDFAIIGGMTPIHQWVRIGAYAMVGGLSRITHDIPPYTIGAGVPYKLGGLNLIGLKRHQFSLEVRKNLTKAFKWLYRSPLSYEEALEKMKGELGHCSEIQHWLGFCRNSKRGLIGLRETSLKEETDEYEEFLEEVDETEAIAR